MYVKKKNYINQIIGVVDKEDTRKLFNHKCSVSITYNTHYYGFANNNCSTQRNVCIGRIKKKYIIPKKTNIITKENNTCSKMKKGILIALNYNTSTYTALQEHQSIN